MSDPNNHDVPDDPLRVAGFDELESDTYEDAEPPEPDGECFRGHEAENFIAEQQAWIQRNLK
jgi:hypothetical protein